MSRIRFEKTRLLVPHPLLERVGMMQVLANHFLDRAGKAGKNRADHKERGEELLGDWRAIVDSVSERGVLEPLKVCRIPEGDETPRPMGCEWFIVDGRNRWKAAQAVSLNRVPVIRVRTEDAPAIIAATVAARRHYTKGATAYLACLLHPEFALQNGPGRKSRTECGITEMTTERLAARFSVSLRLLEQAAELFRLLEKHPRYREDAEASVWAGCGIGGVLSGVQSLIKTGRDEKRAGQGAEEKAFRFLSKGSAQLRQAWQRWDLLEPEQQENFKIHLRDTLAEAPPAVRSILSEIAAE